VAERIQRHPILRFLGSLMVGQAMWRRNALGEGSVAPTPELLTPDPVEPALRTATKTTQLAPTKPGLVERISAVAPEDGSSDIRRILTA